MSWLQERGFEEVFLDIDKHAGIPPGANWERELYRKIASAQAVILVVTPNWHESKWCFVEFAQARALGKAIFPLIVVSGGDRYIAPDIQQLDLMLDREGGLERLARELTRLALDAQDGFAWPSGRPPYPGLMMFEKEDAAVFFGREDEVRSLIEQLNAKRVRGGLGFVAVLGSSGSGKSSILRAGVLPRLERDRANWIVCPPFRPRRDPDVEFARALADLHGNTTEWRQWAEVLRGDDPAGALDNLAAGLRLATGRREATLLVTIDQGEEFFSVAAPAAAANFLTALLRTTAQDVPLVVVLALRSDYLNALQQAAGSLHFDHFGLGPLPLERVRAIIEGPARVAGLRVEDGLAVAAMRDMETDDALPLLAFMLRELYARFGATSPAGGDGAELSVAHYRMLGEAGSGLNPLENVVRRRADEVIIALRLPDEVLVQLKEVVVGSLVRIDDDGRYARQPAVWDKIPAAVKPVLERLVEARLAVIRHGEGITTVEVAHEALLRKWPLVRDWLKAEHDFLIGRVQLRFALRTWQSAGKRPEALLHGLALERAREALRDHAGALSEMEQAFIKASIARYDAETAADRRRRRLAWTGLALVALLAGLAGFSWWERGAASLRAEASRLAVLARTGLAIDPVAAANDSVAAVGKLRSADTLSVLLETTLAISPHLARVVRIPELQAGVVAWAADGRGLILADQRGRLITAEGDGSALRPLARAGGDGQEPALQTLTPAVLGLAVAGPTVLTVADDGLRQSWSSSQAKGFMSLRLPGVQRLTHAALDAAGHVLASNLDAITTLFTCSGSDSCKSAPIETGPVAALAWSGARGLAAVGLEDGRVTIGGTAEDRVELAAGTRPKDAASALAFSPDGDRLAIGTQSGALTLAEPDGTVLARVEAREPGAVLTLAWNDRASLLAGTCGNDSICVWRVGRRGDLAMARRFDGHGGAVRALAFSPDGQRVASASVDGTVRIWSIKPDPAFILLDAGQRDDLTALDLSADTRVLAAGDASGSIHLWQVEETEPRWRDELKIAASSVNALAWAPDGLALAAASENGLVVAPVPMPETPNLVPIDDPVLDIRWLSDASALLVAGQSNGDVSVMKPDGHTLPAFAGGHRERVAALALTPDGKSLLSTGADGVVQRWLVSNREKVGDAIETGAPRDTIAFTRDGTSFLVAGNDGTVWVHAAATGARIAGCSSGSRQIDAAAVSPDGRQVVGLSQEAVLSLWRLDAAYCELLASAPIPNPKPFAPNATPVSAHRPRLVFGAGGMVFITRSTQQIFRLSTSPDAWLARLASLGQQAVR